MSLPVVGEDGVVFERHLIKNRPGRREAVFVGRTRLDAGRRVVEQGWIVKTVSPARARRLVAHYEALALALPAHEPDDSLLPELPALLDHSIAEGWLALAAFPGVALSALPDGTPRHDVLGASVAALAHLERATTSHAQWPRRHWSAAQEAARLTELAGETGRNLPPFARALFAGLADSERSLGLTAAHRDLNEEQIIASPGDAIRRARWIDWDAAAIAPVGLDLGNLLAHEVLRALRSGFPAGDRSAILAAYLAADGRATPRDVARWEAAACLRLAFLARRAVLIDAGERNPEWVPPCSAGPEESERRAISLEIIARELVGL